MGWDTGGAVGAVAKQKIEHDAVFCPESAAQCPFLVYVCIEQATTGFDVGSTSNPGRPSL